MRALEPLCTCTKVVSVSHWPELALELVAFIKLRRLCAERIGCGGNDEVIWRRILLDTNVAWGIYELLGGVAFH